MRAIPCALSLLSLLYLVGCGGSSSRSNPGCLGNSTACSGTCVDLQTDSANCGACGSACASGTGCSGGKCSLACATGEYACGGRCTDPASDPSYCGAAADCSGGAACGTGYACYQGSCASVCAWTQVASYSLTTAPASAIVRTGGIGGQAAATVGGRTAWYQTSDWNVLLIPTGLASSDDTFAVDADIYVPSYTGSGWVAASIALFTTSNTAPGAQGTCQFLGGVFGGIYSTSSGSTLRWWDAISCPQNQLATIGLTFTSGQWNHLQIKGARSTCAYQALVNGTLVSSWTGTCAATGGYFALFGSNHVAGSPADIAWSNLVISKGTQVGCVP